jgi:thioredoxin reductase
MNYDVVIVGGGPAGLAAALTLGRGRKRVMLCDSGPPRNAAAVHVHNFVTRDGITPAEFRRIAREQLREYENVQVRDVRVEAISGAAGEFTVRVNAGDAVLARRVLLCMGMIDQPPPIEGMRELWGVSVFQCPYCHGWEVRDQRFAYLAMTVETLEFAIFLRGWTADVAVLTNGAFEIPGEMRSRLASAGVAVHESPIARLAASGGRLSAIEFADGARRERDVIFVHPPQRQVTLVQGLGLELDEKGFVRLNDKGETSIAGISAAGDLTSPLQSAILAAASGMRAAALVNHALNCG